MVSPHNTGNPTCWRPTKWRKPCPNRADFKISVDPFGIGVVPEYEVCSQHLGRQLEAAVRDSPPRQPVIILVEPL